ncbi:MAG: hypothetical protein L3K15_07365 [Thermoplasmata archaeon]|nr:hypothetical protein [Thermoplasmata archaeon]
MVAADSSQRLDHVVVIMFENRSFDNLLGYLYAPGEVPAFEGVIGRTLTNPVPPEVQGAPSAGASVHPAVNTDSPDPDPGEEYPHINTQMFGHSNPLENRYRKVDEMVAPFNVPTDPAAIPTMTGFVENYVENFRAEMGWTPSFEQCNQIMACHTPEQLPVLTTLARNFACFDHWFCEVPSQTYPNRSFFHAATSSGFLLNGPPGKFASGNNAPTIFERLNDAGLRWRVYFDPEQILSATALIHARRLGPFLPTHFGSHAEFFEDARNGTLPEYAFIEPNLFHPHTDMHPPGAGRVRHLLHLPPPDSIIGGEQLLAHVYNAVRSSSAATGSNWSNTLLLITFDEHGGTFDHVPPPPAVPPDSSAPAGEMGFRFDRSGIRIPTIAVSAWIDPKTVVHETFRSTSMIQTLRTRWGLHGPLTQRDASAPDIAPVLARSSPRPPDEWPSVAAGHIPLSRRIIGAVLRPLAGLERDLLGEALAFEAGGPGKSRLRFEELSHGAAHHHMKRVGSGMFPQIHRPRP